MFEYETSGKKKKKIKFELNEGKVHNISFENGCNGNLKAIAILAEGMDAKELVSKLKGNRCGHKPTSCADQLARAVEKYI
jgi:uncharacterized protein (TIGR03905 family)